MCVLSQIAKWKIDRFERFRIKRLESQIVYVGKPRKKPCLDYVVDIAQRV